MSVPVYWQWDAALNPEIRVIRVLSAVDPKALEWDGHAWRSAVRWACDQWQRTGVVAFVPVFEPANPGTYPAEAGILQITAEDPAKVTPGKTWWGYMNPHIPTTTPELVQAANVWINKTCRMDWWQYVLAHEFGHILGLDHRPSTAKSCMAPVRKFGPDELDLSGVKEAYTA